MSLDHTQSCDACGHGRESADDTLCNGCRSRRPAPGFADAAEVLADVRHHESARALDLGEHDPINPAFVECQGDGFFHHPLLAAPGDWRLSHCSVQLSGEVRDGRGYHPAATFSADLDRSHGQLHRDWKRDQNRLRGEVNAAKARHYHLVQHGF